MSGVLDVAWRLEDMNVYSVVGGEEEKRGRSGSGEVYSCSKQRLSSVCLESNELGMSRICSMSQIGIPIAIMQTRHILLIFSYISPAD